MQKMKRFMSLVVLCTFLVYTTLAGSALTLSDIGSHWAQSEITKWQELEILNGYSDGTFLPNKAVTRAEFLAFIVRVFKFDQKSENNFKDVISGSWYEDDLLKGYEAGIIKGYGNGVFKPNANITRQEAAVMTARAYELTDNSSTSYKDFADSNLVQDWAMAAISSLKDSGYIQGQGQGLFNPSAAITRAETVKMLDNVMGMLVQYDGEYSQSVQGNLVVNTSGVALKDMTIDGDLYITPGVGEGELILDGVTVKGKVIVKGGGTGAATKARSRAIGNVKNCIILLNTQIIGEVFVNKKGGNVKIAAIGATDVGNVNTKTSTNLQESGIIGGTGFGNVNVINATIGVKIELDGDFDDVRMDSIGTFLDVLGGSVSKLDVSTKGKDSDVKISNGNIGAISVFAKAVVNLAGGFVDSLDMDEGAGDSDVQMSGSTIESVVIKAKMAVRVTSGIVNNLDVNEGAKDCTVKVNGVNAKVNKVVLKSNTDLEVSSGEVGNVDIRNTAIDAMVKVLEKAVIKFVTADAKTTITGKVENAVIKAQGVIMDILPDIFEIIGDVIAEIGGENKDKDNDSGKPLTSPSQTSIPTATATPTVTPVATTPPVNTTPPVINPPPVTNPNGAITEIKAVVNGGYVYGTVSNANLTATLDFTGKDNSDILTKLLVFSNGNKITTSTVVTSNLSTIKAVKELTNLSDIKISDLLGSDNPDVSIGSLRRLGGNKLTIHGTLSGSGINQKQVKLELILSDNFGEINQDYTDVTTEGRTVTCSIKAGKQLTKVSDLNLYTVINSYFGEVPSEVKADPNGSYRNVITESQTIKDEIGALAGRDWDDLELGDLILKTMMFKKDGDTAPYTLNIVMANDYLTLVSSDSDITAKIKSGKESTKLSDIGVNTLISLLYNNTPDEIKINSSYIAVDLANFGTIQAELSMLATGSSSNWSTVTLANLDGKTIYFKENSKEYKLMIEN